MKIHPKINFILIIISFIFFCVNLHAQEDEIDGTRDYFEDNYEATPYETLPPEFDQMSTYWPNELNESGFMEDGKVYIHSIEQDPPSAFWIHLYDARSQLYTSSEIDINVVIGIWDQNRNLIAGDKQKITVQLQPGWTKVKVNMHNYKAQIIGAGLEGLRTKSKIKTLEFKDKT